MNERWGNFHPTNLQGLNQNNNFARSNTQGIREAAVARYAAEQQLLEADD
jgi:hypothetical protein